MRQVREFYSYVSHSKRRQS